MRFPVLMGTRIAKGPRVNIFDEAGELISSHGPRLQLCRLRLRFQMQVAKVRVQLGPTRIAEWPKYKPPPQGSSSPPPQAKRLKETVEVTETPKRAIVARGEGKRAARAFSLSGYL